MLKQRLITAAFLIAFILLAVFVFGPGEFFLTVGAVVAFAADEWARLVSGATAIRTRIVYVACTLLLFILAHFLQLALLVFSLAALFWILATIAVLRYPNLPTWLLHAPGARLCMGLFVIMPFGLAATEIRWGQNLLLTSNHISELLVVIALVATENTCAYFAGKRLGKTKLVPNLSPGKTWAGLVGGIAGTTVVAVIIGLSLGASAQQLLIWIMVAWVVDLAAVVGDLFESLQKRVSGVKDSGTLLPGHGGILDRIDSATAALPLFAFITLLVGNHTWP
jgi:phosphatidate cytidylyltransferase